MIFLEEVEVEKQRFW